MWCGMLAACESNTSQMSNKIQTGVLEHRTIPSYTSPGRQGYSKDYQCSDRLDRPDYRPIKTQENGMSFLPLVCLRRCGSISPVNMACLKMQYIGQCKHGKLNMSIYRMFGRSKPPGMAHQWTISRAWLTNGGNDSGHALHPFGRPLMMEVHARLTSFLPARTNRSANHTTAVWNLRLRDRSWLTDTRISRILGYVVLESQNGAFA